MSGDDLQLAVTVIVERDDDRWLARCPAFRGLLMDGKTVEEAMRRARRGLDLYLASLERRGDPLPVGRDCAIRLHQGEQTATPVTRAVKKRATRRLTVPCPSFATV